MKKRIVLLLIIYSLISSVAFAGTRYNLFTRKYEVASKEEVLTYNPFTNTYVFAYPDNKWEYNAHERKYEPSKPNRINRYND